MLLSAWAADGGLGNETELFKGNTSMSGGENGLLSGGSDTYRKRQL